MERLDKVKKIKSVVIIPIGPTTNTEFLLDTIHSIKYYFDHSHKIILVNDSQKETEFDPDIYQATVVNTPKSMGKQSGLYFSLCLGMAVALEKYKFEVLLRMDDDALITGFKPEIDASKYFISHPEIGMLGSYRITWDNQPRDFDPPRKEILIETSPIWKLIKIFRSIKSNNISSHIELAQQHGYELGDHVLGGAYFMSYKLVKKLSDKDLLSSTDFIGSRLEEDHIFGILTHEVGMKLGDFVTNGWPMCLKWRGMPTTPETIYNLNKKIVHSTRFFDSMTEKEVRNELMKYRS